MHYWILETKKPAFSWLFVSNIYQMNVTFAINQAFQDGLSLQKIF